MPVFVKISQLKTQGPAIVSLTTGTISCSSGTTYVTVNATGGKAPYKYTINGKKKAGGTANNVKAETYTIVITDANKCTADTTITVTQPAKLKIAAIVKAPTCKGKSNRLITVIASGGTAPYHNINQGAYKNSFVFSGLTAGIYNISVKDANGCVTASTVNLPDGKKNCPASIALSGSSNENIAAGQTFDAYVLPNPASDYFTLDVSSSSNDKIDIYVTDMVGRKIYNEGSNQSRSFKLETTLLQACIYLS